MRKLITALVIAALLLTLSSTSVYAAPVEGRGKGGNTAPTVDFVDFVIVGGDTQVTALSPLTEYRVKVTLGDINTIDDITEAEFHIYHTTDPENWDADECAIYKWDKVAGWTMENGGAATSWTLEDTGATHCEAPTDFSGTIGDWYLAFKPGELAQADAVANWHVAVEVWDEHPANTGTGSGGNASMADYAGISMDVATIVFGTDAGIEPGQSAYIETPVSHVVTAQVVSNDIYALQVSSEDWDDGGDPLKTITLNTTTSLPSPTLGSGEFALGIDDDDGTGPDVNHPATPQTVTKTNATITNYETVPRVTTAAAASEATSDTAFYMELWFAVNGIEEVTYSGTITFSVINS